MEEGSRFSRKIAVCLAVLLCVGAGAWLFLFDGGSPQAAKQLVFGDMETSHKGESSGGALKESSPVSGGEAVQADDKGAEVSDSISTLPPSSLSDAHAELVDRVAKAMGETAAALPGGDSAFGNVQNTSPSQGEAKQDSVVTGAFVRDLALWLASNYIPSRREDGNGRSTATLTQGNFRYSNSGTLRSVERDPLKGRSSVLNYVFTPGMLEALYHMYAPRLVEEMELAARKRGRPPLSDAQVADMFMVYAGEFRRLSASLDAAAQVDLAALSSSIHSAAEKEAKANDDFARAYTALCIAREAGNTGEVAIQSQRMSESSHIAGIYAARQERARGNMAYALRRKAGDDALPHAELVFLGEWLSRRQASAEAIHASAVVCARMAKLCEEKALAVRTPQDVVPSDITPQEPQPVSQPSEQNSEVPVQPQVAEVTGSAPAASENTPAGQKADAVHTKAAEPSPPASVPEAEAAHSSPPFVREVSGSLSFEPLPKSEQQKAEDAMPESAEAKAMPSSSANAKAGADVLPKNTKGDVPQLSPVQGAHAAESSASGGTPSAEQQGLGAREIQPAPEMGESSLPSSEKPASAQNQASS